MHMAAERRSHYRRGLQAKQLLNRGTGERDAAVTREHQRDIVGLLHQRAEARLARYEVIDFALHMRHPSDQRQHHKCDDKEAGKRQRAHVGRIGRHHATCHHHNHRRDKPAGNTKTCPGGCRCFFH